MALNMHEGIRSLVAELRAEGFDAREDLFREQVGLTIAEKGTTIPPADFFPLWELNQNLDLVATRDFAGIRAKRPTNWSPLRHENSSEA